MNIDEIEELTNAEIASVEEVAAAEHLNSLGIPMEAIHYSEEGPHPVVYVRTTQEGLESLPKENTRCPSFLHSYSPVKPKEPKNFLRWRVREMRHEPENEDYSIVLLNYEAFTKEDKERERQERIKSLSEEDVILWVYGGNIDFEHTRIYPETGEKILTAKSFPYRSKKSWREYRQEREKFNELREEYNHEDINKWLELNPEVMGKYEEAIERSKLWPTLVDLVKGRIRGRIPNSQI